MKLTKTEKLITAKIRNRILFSDQVLKLLITCYRFCKIEEEFHPKIYAPKYIIYT